MLRRLLSVSILLPSILLLLWLDFYLGKASGMAMPGLIMACIGIVLGGIMAVEIRSLWATKQSKLDWHGLPNDAQPDLPSASILISGTVIMLMVACLLPVLVEGFLANLLNRFVPRAANVGQSTLNVNPLLFSFYGLIAAFTWTFSVEMYHFKVDARHSGLIANRISRSALVYIYVLMLFGFLIPHRWLLDDNRIGLISLIGLIATVKMSDSFAYFAGKTLGTVKLAPELSPKKTIQGACGSVMGGLIAAVIVFYSVTPFVFGISNLPPWWWVVIYAVVISIAAMFGDLAESLLKRDAACKDSGSMLPGMGGILDVLDSLIFASPISYLLWHWIVL